MRITDEMVKNSIVHKGDITKIENILMKAKNGQDITVAFLGGSITQGCNATLYEECYANRTYLWFKNTFKDVNVTFINAGVGATGSVIGVHRVEKQVLSQNPDIVFIDFAVNDKDDKYHREAYESLIRRILLAENAPAIIEVFMSTDTGYNVQDQQIEIGKKYNIPMISFRNTIYSEMMAGRIKWEEVATDNVHPNTEGHFIISELLISFLKDIYSKLEKRQVTALNLDEPLFGEKYKAGVIFNNLNLEAKEKEGFIEDELGFQVFQNGWKFVSDNSGSAKLKLEIQGRSIFLLYKKSILEVAGKLKVSVDGGETKVLDTFFNDGWGDYSETELLVEEDILKVHTIEIAAIDEGKAREISVLGFLVS